MQQLNIAYKDDTDSISLDELPLDTQSALSPGRIRRASDQTNVRHTVNLDDIPIAVITKNKRMIFRSNNFYRL